MKKNVHVTYRPKQDIWAVLSAGASRAAALSETKTRALQIGREIAQKRKVELVIHGRNTLIKDSDSFGNDPFPPKDKQH